MDWLIPLDGTILLWIQEYVRKDFLDPIVLFITNLGNAGWIWILLTAVLLISKKYRDVGIASLIALLLGFVVTNLCLKQVVARVRPYEVIEGLELIGRKAVDFSFPSGHATSSIAVSAVLLCRLPKKFGIPLILLGSLIALSRLYIGIHYPSDVAAGIVIGAAAAGAAMRFRTKSMDTDTFDSGG